MNSGSKSVRKFSVDILKVLAIFGVVFIHCDGGGVYVDCLRSFFRWCVPVFIVFFSYFLELGLSKRAATRPYLVQRAKTVAVPFIAWSTIYWFVFPEFHESLDFGFSNFLTSLGYAWSGQYFFLLLIQLLACFPLIRLVKPLQPFVLLCWSFFLILLSYVHYGLSVDSDLGRFIQIVSVRTVLFWWPYALLGIFLARGRRLRIPQWCWVSLLLLSFEKLYFGLDRLRDFSPYLNPWAAASALVLASFACQHNIEMRMLGDKTRALITSVSKNTMGIFVLNPLLIYLLGHTHTISPSGDFSRLGLAILSAFIVTILAWWISLFLKRIRLGYLVGG